MNNHVFPDRLEETLAEIEAHLARSLRRQFELERLVAAYRGGKGHRTCKPLPLIDARCGICRLADALLQVGG